MKKIMSCYYNTMSHYHTLCLNPSIKYNLTNSDKRAIFSNYVLRQTNISCSKNKKYVLTLKLYFSNNIIISFVQNNIYIVRTRKVFCYKVIVMYIVIK